MYRLASAVLVTGAVLAACSGSGQTSGSSTTSEALQTTTTTRPDDGSLLIGLVVPMQGAGATIGADVEAGVRLAVAEINGAGGVLGSPVRLVVRDEGERSATAVAAIGELVRLQVDAIIGPVSSLTTLGSLATAVNAGVVTCSPTASAAALDHFPDDDLLFRTIPSDTLEMSAMAKAVDEGGGRSVAIAYVDDGYGRPLAATLDRAVRAQGPSVSALVPVANTDAGRDEAVAAIIAADPDTVAVIADPVSGTALLAKLAAADPSGHLSFVVNDAMRNVQSGTPVPESVLRRTSGVAALTEASNAAYLADVRLQSPGVSGAFSQNAYNCANLIALAASSAGSITPLAMAGNIRQVATGGTSCTSFPECDAVLRAGRNIDYDGPAGTLDIGSSGDPTTAIFERFQFDSSGRDTVVGTFAVTG